MIETIVLALFILAMLTLAAAVWSLSSLAAAYAPQTGGPRTRRPAADLAWTRVARQRSALQARAPLHSATTNSSF